jgi:hypothetical protein
MFNMSFSKKYGECRREDRSTQPVDARAMRAGSPIHRHSSWPGYLHQANGNSALDA